MPELDDDPIAGSPHKGGEGTTRGHDSGLASPNDVLLEENASSGGGGSSGNPCDLLVDPTAALGLGPRCSAVNSSGKQRMESGEMTDGGLGSSVCGEEPGEVTTGCSSPATTSGLLAPRSPQKEPAVPAGRTPGGPAKNAKESDPVGDTASAPRSKGQQPQQQHQMQSSAKDQKRDQQKQRQGNDSGRGSEADDGVRVAYIFHFPSRLIAKFIGTGGAQVKRLTAETKCFVQLKGVGGSDAKHRKNRNNVPQYCFLEGTRSSIDRCLDLIREKFPFDEHPDLTLDQINLPVPGSCDGVVGLSSSSYVSVDGTVHFNSGTLASVNHQHHQPMQLGLDQGVVHEVVVSAVVSGGQVFLQQPLHPTFKSLYRLEVCLYNVYTKLAVPVVPKEYLGMGLLCIARYKDHFYRVQIMSYDPETETCSLKSLDYGGYFESNIADLWQIRSDFLALPFQALECLLGNVLPPEGSSDSWPLESATVLSELVAGQVITGRMLGFTDAYVPVVHLYGIVGSDGEVKNNGTTKAALQPRLLNRELVDRGAARWTDYAVSSS